MTTGPQSHKRMNWGEKTLAFPLVPGYIATFFLVIANDIVASFSVSGELA